MTLNFIFKKAMLEAFEETGFVIVCHCRGVSDRKIRQAIRQGACSRGEVARACQAGGICGGCTPSIDEILRSERGPDAARSSSLSVELAVLSS